MSDLERVRGAFARLFESLFARLDYSCFYPASVVAQNGDGSLELKSLSPKLPHLSKVAIRYGIPGVEAKLVAGGRVLVGFESADPSQPFCLVHDMAAVDTLIFMKGTKPMARMGDAANVFFPPVVPVSGTVAGAPFVGVMTIATSAPAIITSGNPKLLG